jgi:hypothetical protein
MSTVPNFIPESPHETRHDPNIQDALLPGRRAVLLGLAAIAVETGLSGYPQILSAQPAAADAVIPAAAPLVDPGFLLLSQRLTDHTNISPVTAQRIRDALAPAGVKQAAQVEQLVALASQHNTAESLLEAATQVGLKDLALGIVAAWYTGTVGQGSSAVMVAYEEALMYQPVRDGLTVPTYCNFGPLWWTGLPPDAAQMPADATPATGTPA